MTIFTGNNLQNTYEIQVPDRFDPPGRPPGLPAQRTARLRAIRGHRRGRPALQPAGERLRRGRRRPYLDRHLPRTQPVQRPRVSPILQCGRYAGPSRQPGERRLSQFERNHLGRDEQRGSPSHVRRTVQIRARPRPAERQPPLGDPGRQAPDEQFRLAVPIRRGRGPFPAGRPRLQRLQPSICRPGRKLPVGNRQRRNGPELLQYRRFLPHRLLSYFPHRLSLVRRRKRGTLDVRHGPDEHLRHPGPHLEGTSGSHPERTPADAGRCRYHL